MINTKYKRLHVFLVCLLCAVYCFLFTVSCGRRGDPVPVEPRVEQPAAAVEGAKDTVPDVVREEKVKGDTAATTPGALTGLRGVYTETGIVITWDEIEGRDFTYRVYRSTGEGYSLAGEAVTPAFTDRDIKPGGKYKYRVTAVGGTEGPPSKEITIVTEIQ